MKADKAFYDKLRAEVSQSDIRSDVSFFTVAEKENVKAQEMAEEMLALQNKLVGLELQVSLLEKRNEDLTQENIKLQKPTSVQPSAEKVAKTKRGLIPVENIIKWAYETCGDDHFICYMRNMLQDFEWDSMLKGEDYCPSIKKYEQEKMEQRKQPVINEVVMNKYVENEVTGVATGATGVIVNKGKLKK